MRTRLEPAWRLAARELLFRVYARHRPGPRPNIALYCFPRSGSTWMINTIASHPGLRQMPRPFMTMTRSRRRRHMPDLARAAEYDRGDREFWHWVHFPEDQEAAALEIAGRILRGEWFIYPPVNFWEPYAERTSERLLFQITHAMPLIEWFDEHFELDTVVLLRHPVSSALANVNVGFQHECEDFVEHRWFRDTYLTGEQVDLARKVIADGNPVATHVLDWTLRLLVPLRKIGDHPDWLPVTYEHAVLDPRAVVGILSERLDLPDVESMMATVKRPSRTVAPGTVGHTDDPDFLIKRWKKKIGPEEERALMEIPHTLGVTAYEPGRLVASSEFLHGWAPPGDVA